MRLAFPGILIRDITDMNGNARRHDGFTLIELLVATIIVGVLASLALNGVRRARLAGELGAAAVELKQVHGYFEVFYKENGMYPNATSNPFFELDSFEPLDYGTGIQNRLVDGQADAYDSPDDQGTNQEYWVTMTLAKEPSIQLIVANSDNVPLAPGQWLDGIYMYHDGEVSQTFGVP